MANNPTIKRINDIYSQHETQIKQILIEQAARFPEFPRMLIGIPDKKYASITSGIEGLAMSLPGILIHDENKFWSNNTYAVMLRDGLYIMRAGRFVTTKDGAPLNEVAALPSWESRYEDGYVRFGFQAAHRMEELLEELAKPKKGKRS